MTKKKRPENGECTGCRLIKFCKYDCATADDANESEVKAIMLCLVVPCVLLIIAVLALSLLISTFWGCIFGLCTVIIYYGLFYLLKGRIKS